MPGEFRRSFVIGALVALTGSAVVAGGVSAKPSGPGPGNAPNAKACQKGGWLNLVTSTGDSFASQGECVAYAAQGGVLEPKPTTPQQQCEQALADAELTEPENPNYIFGTAGNDDFTGQMTDGNDVVCGFAGNDLIGFPAELEGNDIFLGGEGDDNVTIMDGGTFNGGDGDDSIFHMFGGTFNGGDGCDTVGLLAGGTFNPGDQSTCMA